MITYTVENWTEAKEEAATFWQAHWEEVGQNKIKLKLDPDIEKLDRLNDRGMLHIVIARDAGKMVGYHASIIDTLVHYRTILSARGDLYWLHPDYRKGFVGIKLLKEVEKTLKLRGVKVISDITKLYFDHGAIFERLGYKPIERVYTKWIGD